MNSVYAFGHSFWITLNILSFFSILSVRIEDYPGCTHERHLHSQIHPSLATPGFKTPSWQQCKHSACGFKTWLDKPVGGVTVATSTFYSFFPDTLFLLLDLWHHRQQICLVWSYAAVAQGSMWYGFRDALRHTLIVMWLSQLLSSHSPPMPDIKKIFSPRELALAGYFSLFLTILCKPQRCLWWESSGDQQFLKLSDRPVWHQQPCHIQRLLKQFFFPILMLSLSWPCLHA